MVVLNVTVAILAVLPILFLIYLLVLIRPARRVKPDASLLCDYAHRGLHGNGIPENSRTAFGLACERGVGIELDVQLSRDGTVMVFHDYTLSRMTGLDKMLCELDADALRRLSLNGTEQTIPTFSEVLSLVDGRVPLLVELKGENFDTALCEKVAALLREYDGAYCLESFNPLLIGKMKTYLPDAFCGLLYTNVCRDKKKRSALNIALTGMALNAVARPDFIAYNKQDRHTLPVKIATRLYRTPRFVWTVKSEEERQTARRLGECAIFEETDKR